MSQIEWFKNEVELVNEFLSETAVGLASVEAYDAKITLLKDEKNKVEQPPKSMWSEEKEARLDKIITAMEEEVKVKVMELQRIKEHYIAEEIVDTMETLGSTEEGEELSDEVCKVIGDISGWMRKYYPDYIL